MRLVMTLRARDEADIVDAQIAFHLNAGVDHVIATDHRSSDGTTEVLESYARDGYLHLTREEGDGIGADWVTRMARQAATNFGADWVINADADEFWWPRAGTLKEVLESIPARYGVVRGLWRHFIPRPDDGVFFAERMTVRASPRAPINAPASPYRPDRKSAHRASPDVRVGRGNHDLLAGGLVPLRGWYPIEVLHFRLRSPEQAARKFAASWDAWSKSAGSAPTSLAAAGFAADRAGSLAEFYASLGVDDDGLERGLVDGSLVVDTRLRDLLRTLRRDPAAAGHGSRAFRLPGEGEPLRLPRPSVADDAAYAVDVSAFDEANGVRLERRVDELERRLASLEQGGLWPRVRSRALRSSRRAGRP
jgi:hypothetical protein